MRKLSILLLITLVFRLTASEQLADNFSFHKIFTDNMVLQRDRPLRLGGTADPGRAVALRFGKTQQRVTADAGGRWRAVFPALPAGGPHAVTLSGRPGSPAVTLKNILIGEVWLCSGQSNMAMPVYSDLPWWRALNARAERDSADYPEIRLFQVPHTQSLIHPREEITGRGWQICTPETAAGFSALAYFYGRKLHRDLKVPVGLIQACVSGSPIESWLPMHTYLDHQEEFPNSMVRINFIKDLMGKMDREKAARLNITPEQWIRQFNDQNPAAAQAAEEYSRTDFPDQNWQATPLPWKFPAGKDGIVWFRTAFPLPEQWPARPMELQLGQIRDGDETYFNGQKIGGTNYRRKDYDKFSRVYHIPAGLARKAGNVLAVRVSNYRGGGSFGDQPGKMNIRCPGNGQSRPLPKIWKNKIQFLVPSDQLPQMPGYLQKIYDFVNSLDAPATLYNAMIHPWLQYEIRGVIWYQGCANYGNTDYYGMHRYLIQNWRRAWKNPGMPFLLVQLSAFGGGTPWKPKPDGFWKNLEPADREPWAVTREIQAEMTKIPNVGMAVSIDRGEHSNIHPADKQTVALRLAAEAERIVYGRNIVSRGPSYNKMKIEGKKIRIFFSHAESGLKTGDGQKPGCFAIAGKDGHFVWADTEISGNTVLVSSPRVPAPAAVRYGWVGYRDNLNLYNAEGFPAVPFRTDKDAYSIPPPSASECVKGRSLP